MSALILKVQTESGNTFEKQYPQANTKPRKVTITTKKLKLDSTQAPVDFLRFEFTKIEDSIEVQYLLLQTPREPLLPKPEKKIKQPLRQSLLESATKKNEALRKQKQSENEVNVKDIYGFDDKLAEQQERMKGLLPSGAGLAKEANGYSSEGSRIEGLVKSPAYNTRSSCKEFRASNSCHGLFEGKVVSVLIENKELRRVVVEVLEAFGAVYLEEPSDSCSFIVAEKVFGIEGVQEVTVKWLFECAEKREILPYE